MLYHRTKAPPGPSDEDEAAIDSELRALVDLSLKFEGGANSGTSGSSLGSGAGHGLAVLAAREPLGGSATKKPALGGGDGVDAFDLALTACRITRVRRLTSRVATAGREGAMDASCGGLNPYNVLLDKYPKTRPKHLFIMFDQLSAILSTVQATREKVQGMAEVKSPTWLDKLALEVARGCFEELEISPSSTAASQNTSSSSTLFVNLDSARDLRLNCLREAKRHFARAVSLYRSTDFSHGTVAQWADLFISVLRLFQKERDMAGSLGGSLPSQRDSDQVLAEVMAVKAYALSMSGNYASALKTARGAWELLEKVSRPNIHNLTVLFHCCVLQDTKGASKVNVSSSGNAMLELDNALSSFLSSSETTSLSESTTNDLLSVFPVLSNSCIENESNSGGALLLGVQERWVTLFTKSDSVVRELCKPIDITSANKELEPPGGISLFCILQAYFANFEHLVGDDMVWNLRSGEALDRTLDSVLQLLCKIRDRWSTSNVPKGKRKKRGKRNELIESKGSNYTLIWDHMNTKRLVGEHKECISCAESLWNIGMLFMKIDITGSSDAAQSHWIAAQIFAKAHDFALLSEDEEGLSLTKKFLNCEMRCFEGDSVSIPRFASSREECKGSELSSEFSAQCLLLSVANVVDNLPVISSNDGIETAEEKTGVKERMRHCLYRLSKAKEEFTANTDEWDQQKYVDSLIAWLALRCLVELADDDLCSDVLNEGGLFHSLQMAEVHGTGAGNKGLTDSTLAEKKNVTLSHLLLLSERAGLRQMPGTAKHLIRFCIIELSRLGTANISCEGNSKSLGNLQKKLIQYASSVQEVVDAFTLVDTTVKSCEGNDAAFQYYSKDDLGKLIFL